MYTSLAIDAHAADYLLQAPKLPLASLSNQTFILPKAVENVRLVQVEEHAYLFSIDANKDSALIVIRLGDDGVLSAISQKNRAAAFYRILRAGVGSLSSSLNIPVNWRTYHWKSRVSFQSNPEGTGEKARIILEQSPDHTKHCYFFATDTSGKTDIQDLNPKMSVFRDSISSRISALKSFPVPGNDSDTREFDLTDSLSLEVTHGYTYRIWYETYLTDQQLRFVDYDAEGPLRLRGPAGTGKTVALVVRFLRQAYNAVDTNQARRFAFLASNTATVELIRQYISSIDDRNLLYDGGDCIVTRLATLHELADEHLAYGTRGLAPLSLDAYEGRILQIELLSSIIENCKNSRWINDRRHCSLEFATLIESDLKEPEGLGFVYDILNEFGCVIDVARGANPTERRANYLKERRAQWMFPIREEYEKSVITTFHKEFTEQLSEMGVVSIDQMIADYHGFLSSFQWAALRREQGFDFIFVDELHLLNRMERLTLHALTTSETGMPNVYMAYDPRQSPRDTFLHVEDARTGDIWVSAKLGRVQPFDLDRVFRYTPQIAKFLQSLDHAFPAAEFGAEWAVQPAISEKDDGPVPKLIHVADSQSLYNTVFANAARMARSSGRGKRVAVLCLSFNQFEVYRRAGKYKESMLTISSRSEIEGVGDARKRFIFSMPEYVAGLQFEVVYLIEANENDVAESGTGLAARRRFVSSIYLGASRAQTVLDIYCNRSRGGSVNELKLAVEQETLLVKAQ